MSETKSLKKLCVYWHSDVFTKPNMTCMTVGELEAVYWMEKARKDQDLTIVPYDRILLRQCFTRVGNPFMLMEWLHLLAAPGAQLVIDSHYGSHDAADEDLHAQRRVFKDTFRAFEPAWKYHQRTFYLDGSFFENTVDEMQIAMSVANLRNVCKGMAAELICQKPVPEGYKPTDPISAYRMI